MGFYPMTTSDPQGKSQTGIGPRLRRLGFLFMIAFVIVMVFVLVHYAVDIFRRPETSHIGHGISEISNLKSALDTFEQDNGRYPTTEEGLQALIDPPAGVGESWHRLLDALPADKWGTPYRYQYGTHGKSTFDLYSAGPDKIFDTSDDVRSGIDE